MKKIVYICICFICICFLLTGCGEKIDYDAVIKDFKSEFDGYYQDNIKGELEKIVADTTGYSDIRIDEYRLSIDEDTIKGSNPTTKTLKCAFVTNSIDSFNFSDGDKIRDILTEVDNALKPLEYEYTFNYGKDGNKTCTLKLSIEAVSSSATVDGFDHYCDVALNGNEHCISLNDYSGELQARADGQLMAHYDDDGEVDRYSYDRSIYSRNRGKDSGSSYNSGQSTYTPTDPNAKTCPICKKSFSDSENKKSIRNTNMCSNCYNNYKIQKDLGY